MNVYETAAKLMAQVSEAATHRAQAQKAGARHSAKDNAMVQEMHDRACELGAKCHCETPTHPMLKGALVLRHPGHGSQKVHNPHKHGNQVNEFEAVSIRLNNAENKFVDSVMEQFGKSKQEAEIILSVFKKKKAIKIDPVLGKFSLTHGALWDKQVMDTALDLAKEKPKKKR
jgi:hypothetical protein